MELDPLLTRTLPIPETWEPGWSTCDKPPNSNVPAVPTVKLPLLLPTPYKTSVPDCTSTVPVLWNAAPKYVMPELDLRTVPALLNVPRRPTPKVSLFWTARVEPDRLFQTAP